MHEIKKALLEGLKTFGRKKTFHEILTEAGFATDKMQRIELANELETLGLIQTVTYRLPFEIRAELSPTGKKSLSDTGANHSAIQSFLFLLGLSNQGWALM